MLKDRVKVITNTSGTGVITLGTAEKGFQGFDSIGSSDVYYALTNGNNWEVGYGTHSSGLLSRNSILDSSNSGNIIDLSGKSYVFITYPADKAVYLSPYANPSSGDLLFKTELGWLGRPLSSGDIGSALGFIPPSSQNTYTSNSGIVSYLNNFSLGGTGKLSNLLFDTNIVVGGSPPENNNQKNVILGWNCGISGSLYAVNTSENVFIGNNCGKNNLYNLYAIEPKIEYTYNVVIGSSGLYNTSSYCQKNIAIGLNSLNGTVPSGATYSNVISIGNGACSRVDNCSNSIYIGQSAGARSFLLDSSVGIGSYAGYGSSGIKNTYIGYFAGYLASGDNNIEIFNGINFPYSLLYGQNSNKLNIGSVIVGDINNKKIAIGDVSSGNLNPNATLEILPKASSDKGLIVKSKSGHSANLFELQDSGSAVKFSISPSGFVSGVNGYLSSGLNLNNSTLLNSNINNYSETIVPVSIVNSGLSLNLSSGNVFSCLLNSNITGVSVLNPRSSGAMHSFSLSLDYIDSGRSIIWPSNVYWNGGSGYAPILSSGIGRSAMISFSTSNGGSTYLGYVGGMNFGV